MSDGAVLGSIIGLAAFVVALLGLILNSIRSNYQTFATHSQVNDMERRHVLEMSGVKDGLGQMENRLNQRLDRIENKLDKHIEHNGG